MYGKDPPCCGSQTTFDNGPTDETHSTSVDSPSLKNERGGSNLISGRLTRVANKIIKLISNKKFLVNLNPHYRPIYIQINNFFLVCTSFMIY